LKTARFLFEVLDAGSVFSDPSLDSAAARNEALSRLPGLDESALGVFELGWDH
jgi:hypothetical protein